MKYIIITIVSLFSLTVFSQAEDQNFYLVDGQINWQKAYSTEKNKEEVLAYFENSDIFKKVIIENGQIIGELKPHEVDPNKTGVADVPKIVNKNNFYGEVVIRYRSKEKDYVVQFTNLKFYGTGEYLKKKAEKPFEEQFYSVSTGKYRPGFLKSPKEVYNITFLPIFEMK
jgi:hypothetical protein